MSSQDVLSTDPALWNTGFSFKTKEHFEWQKYPSTCGSAQTSLLRDMLGLAWNTSAPSTGSQGLDSTSGATLEIELELQKSAGNAGWSKSQMESWAPSAIQSALSTPLALLLQPKAMPEDSVNLEQHIVTACIPRFTLPSSPSSFKSNTANLSIFPLRSFTLLHTL